MLKLRLVGEIEETPDFETFWRSYPRRVAKRAAITAWSKLSTEDRAVAIEVIHRHVEQWSDPLYIPHPATWLNGRRFEDELEVDLHVEHCHWKGCSSPGVRSIGSASYCEKHVAAIGRGETW